MGAFKLDFFIFLDKMIRRTGRSVTANMLALGASDSGFESRRPDQRKPNEFCKKLSTGKLLTKYSKRFNIKILTSTGKTRQKKGGHCEKQCRHSEPSRSHRKKIAPDE